VKKQDNTSNIAWTEGLHMNKMVRAGKHYALIKLETKPQANLILFTSTESEPGNDDVYNVCPLASELPNLPQSSLWNYCVKNWFACIDNFVRICFSDLQIV
jgi:hypothetical protein